MTLVYNDQGDMVNEQVTEFAKELGRQVDTLLQDLFDQGMTVMECRALIGYLECQLNYTAVFQILNAQLDLKENEDESTRPDNGASAAQPE